MPRRRTFTRGLAVVAATAAVFALSACGADAGAGSTTGSGAGQGYITEGKLTIATGEPAYFPWVIDDAPESGDGFESAVAYAVADKLGFDAADVVWVRSTFDQAIAPGPKDFDFNLQQFSITPERAKAVDFSPAYYETTQAVITVDSSAAAKAGSLADLKGLLIGAQAGTTSFVEAEEFIAPTAGVQVFNTNDDAKLALQNGSIDALVVDLPTAFYLTGVELDGGHIVGQLPSSSEKGDQYGLVLAKGSSLTPAVTTAIDELRADGTLDALAAKWLAGNANAPVLK
ncbi:ABC transporter substrate-binding protein [Leifsonia sp. YAF41]|uniref:ABC transporter substrate-binding protein n=1 Tax=Leifsonia sp. YAF41 TaxID=3233086 RepID=UPI003F9A5987